MARFVAASLVICVSFASLAFAAEPPAAAPPATPAKTPAAVPAGAAAQAFAEKYAQFEALTKKLNGEAAKIPSAPPAERAKLIQDYMAGVTQVEKMLPDLFASAQAAYVAAPNQDEKVTTMVVDNAAWLEGRDDYEAAAKVLKVLEDHKCPDPKVHQFAGIAAFVNNNFEAAAAHFKAATAALKPGETLLPPAENFSDSLAEYTKLWAREQELRAAEAKANDLPRVKLETSKGPLVIELFENEAPQTVANFVSLVEQKFYDGLLFHRVLPNFMAQGGDPKGNGTGGPGYKIYCECGKPEHRAHFRGTLSMAHAGKDTGGSQFFLTFVPTPFLNGRHTVFGRVVEGFDVLAKLERIDPQQPDPTVKPDTIVKATVLRKRDHEYAPTKVK